MRSKLLVIATVLAMPSLISDAQANTVGFLYSGGKFTSLEPSGASFTQAWGINNAGQVVGYYSPTSNPDYYDGFVYYKGSYTTFSFPGASTTVPLDINNKGVIAGYYSRYSGDTAHGFIDDNSNFTSVEINPAPPDYTWIYGINDSGTIIGTYTYNTNMDTDGEDHGVDDTRYACLSRPWARPTPPKKEERTPAPAITLNDLVRATEQRRRNSYAERI